MMTKRNSAISSLARVACLLPAIAFGGWCLLLLAGCASNERREPLKAFLWHGHDEITPPRPAQSSSRVRVPARPVLNTVQDRTLRAWEDFMANEAAAKLRAGLSSSPAPARRDELCGEFLDQAIQERIAAFPKEKIDYSLCIAGMNSGLSSPPAWHEISREEHFKLDKNNSAGLETYYEHRALFNSRKRMLQNIRLVFDDNRLDFKTAMGRFPLVMMLHYEQIGRGIVLQKETRSLLKAIGKVREGL